MLNYEEEVKRRYMKNIVAAVMDEEKIKRDAEKFDISSKMLESLVTDNPLYYVHRYTKDPKKQNIYEKVAFEYLAKKVDSIFSGVRLINLPNGGKGSLMISAGNILPYSKKYSSSAKTIDFLLEVGEYTYYILHKYINEHGGGQDNQYNDIFRFIENAAPCRDIYAFFVAICDGAYFNQEKMDLLRDRATNRIKIYHIDRFVYYLETCRRLSPYFKRRKK